ncbi:hypothetical protein [uncultured Tateyamaria sp.]|uniref:hypothetical protein n=1 Tax=uncultured Tateyamaria sp. TaxID=455651 RepID=UPI0026177962|nr:hypothetical protein [uncultured Tateyamaria sp.]
MSGKRKGKGNRSNWTKLQIEWGQDVARKVGSDPSVDPGIGDDDAGEDYLRDELFKDVLGPHATANDFSGIAPPPHPDDLHELGNQLDKMRGIIMNMSFRELQEAVVYGRYPGELLYDWKVDQEEITRTVEERHDAADTLRLQLEALALPDLAAEHELDGLEVYAKDLDDAETALEDLPLHADSVKLASQAVSRLTPLHGEMEKEILRLDGAFDRIIQEAKEITEEGVLKDQKARLETARSAFEDATEGVATQEKITEAERLLKELEDVALEVTTEITEYGGADALNGLLSNLKMDIDTFESFEATLGGRAAFQKISKAFKPEDILTLAAGIGADKLGDFLNGFGGPAEAVKAITALGSLEKFIALSNPGGLTGTEALALVDTLGGGFVAELMGGANDPTQAIAVQTAVGGDAEGFKTLAAESGLGANPKAFAALVTTGCGNDATAFATFCAGFQGEANDEARADLKGLVEDGGLGAAPEAFGHLVAEVGVADPASMKAVGVAMRADAAREGLEAMLTNGGLAGSAEVDPKCLAALFKNGAGGKPALSPDDDATFQAKGLADLCSNLKSADCDELNKMMTDGGLGQAPDALGHLIGVGCGGKGADAKKLIASFDSDDKREGLERMLTTGGLAGGVGVNPRCLGEILKNGAGPVPHPPAADETVRRTNVLADLCAGMDATACGNLNATLTTGGLGAEPEVLSHVLGLGCDGGKPVKLAALTAKLGEGGGANNDKLKKMLANGGFGTVDAGGLATNTDTKCLGTLLGTGCEGSVDEAANLLTNMGDADFTRMKALMTTGDLGQHPVVLGLMYKEGCCDDPDDPGNHAKNPDVLKGMMAQFAAPHGTAAEFQDLLTNGGFTAGGHEGRLGSVMRHAVKNAAPPAGDGKQNPEALKQFHTAFNGNMAQLPVFMNALETAPAWVLDPAAGNQPGKGFGNITKSPKHRGDASDLFHGCMEDLLTRAGQGQHVAAGRPDLSRDELLQTVASFEHQPVTPPPYQVVGAPPHNKDFKIDHVAERHSRSHSKQELADGGANYGFTTFYPRGTDENVIKAKAGEVIGNIPTANAHNFRPFAQRPPNNKRNPPQDRYDLQHQGVALWGGQDYNNHYGGGGGLADASGMDHFIRYRAGGGGGNVRIPQFYPKGPHAELLEVNNQDMQALQDALQ